MYMFLYIFIRILKNIYIYVYKQIFVCMWAKIRILFCMWAAEWFWESDHGENTRNSWANKNGLLRDKPAVVFNGLF